MPLFGKDRPDKNLPDRRLQGDLEKKEQQHHDKQRNMSGQARSAKKARGVKYGNMAEQREKEQAEAAQQKMRDEARAKRGLGPAGGSSPSKDVHPLMQNRKAGSDRPWWDNPQSSSSSQPWWTKSGGSRRGDDRSSKPWWTKDNDKDKGWF
jgi:hypothetical protein